MKNACFFFLHRLVINSNKTAKQYVLASNLGQNSVSYVPQDAE